MKKLLGIVVLGLLWCGNSNSADPYVGTGELKLSSRTVKSFMQYVRNTFKTPSQFYVTTDGTGDYYVYCPYGNCQSPKKQLRIDECERHYNKECKLFAMRRTVKWKNGINLGKKESKFKHSLSDSEFRAKLTELGFLGNATSSTTTTKPKITKKKKVTKKTTSSSDLAAQIKELKQLLDDGVLTEEEFKKAKKKLLN
jgi:hypothetical protein